MDLRVVVGLNVQRIRRQQALSQEELSFRSGFTRSYLSGLEAGRRNPTILSLEKIASALGASVEDLLRRRSSASWDAAPDQDFDIDLKRQRQDFHGVHGRRVLFALELADIVAIKPGKIGELLLRQARRLSKQPQIAGKNRPQPHRVRQSDRSL
jgi:transcriptional regulator with XRE-family HTH domain